MVEIRCFISYLRCLVRDLKVAPLHEDDMMLRLFAIQSILKYSNDYCLSIGVDYTGTDPKVEMITLYSVTNLHKYTLIWGWKRESGEEWGVWR